MIYISLVMLTLETLHPLYYTEQKAKIGTIELSLKPNIENQYAVEISSKCLRVADCDIDLLEDTRIKCQEIAPPVMNDSVINVRISTDPMLKLPAPKKTEEVNIEKIYCQRCAAKLSCKKFTRTLPLPSAAWHEVTDTLLCHGTHNKMVNGCYPRPGDCLVGEQEVWVAWDVVDSSHVYIDSTRDVEHAGTARVTASLNCHRCRNSLGRVVYNGDKVDWAIIWKHSIKTTSKEVPYHIESYVAHELLDASTRHVSYRFIILPRGTTTAFRGIRLWMMGGDLNITSSLSNEINQALNQFGGSVCENDKAMKVLYTKHSELTLEGIWADADILSLPLDLCLHLWLTLQLSSITLPPSKRYAQKCRVGYIRYS